ncbi:glycoside hydrolase domain-containing protein [Actinomadura sp. GTD37]|uniref:glycoside hydrolase domain-containing protein n=1 Tax=Actinomadura sp. GTD37 TaxID=1778030 RepID=UPI0035BF5822
MRHAVLFSVLSGAAAVAPVLAFAGTVPERLAARPAAGPTEGGGARVVEYRGLRVPVPAGWAVHRLDADPSQCVRYDRHAVYLGRPGPQPDCPARVVGRTEAVHIEPAAGGRGSRTVVHADRLAALTVAPDAGHETRLTLPEAGVTITGVYGRDPARLQRVLRGARVSARWTAAPRASGAPSSPDVRREAPGDDTGDGAGDGTVPDAGLDRPWVRGKGFDTCTAPSLATMKAWRPSFKVTNIYIGGAARGCAQPNLTASWVRKVRKMGYRLTPTYVGLQAPCGSRPQRFTAKNAAGQGAKAAVDAARRARALGVPEGKPIYFDMEAYNTKKKACRAAVLRFVDQWVERLAGEGYVPCLYSSAKSGIRDVGRADGISKPAAVWFANWNGRASVYDDPFLPNGWWSPHRRIKQYRGAHKERHGGVTLNIDRNIVDGRVY